VTLRLLVQPFVDPLLGPIATPLAAAVLCALCPERWRVLRVALAAVAAAVAGLLVVGHLSGDTPTHWALLSDPLSAVCSMGAAVATLLVTVFMLGWSAGRAQVVGHRLLVACICGTLATANAVFFAKSLLLLLAAWGTLAVLLYLMIAAAGETAAPAARKAAMIVGGADAALLFGVVLLSGGDMDRNLIDALGSSLGLAFALCAVAALAKMGAAPLHAWVAPCASRAHAPTAALLLGAIDKLLGGYLLMRLVGERSSALLLAIGVVSIAVGMLLAVTDRDAKRLLGYSSVAQVGFVLLGLGSGTAIGRAGALFHLANNAIYKPALFLTTAAAERRTGSCDLRDLGGLARELPVTFAATLICGLALAGVPPLSGFFSKWMIYQGLFESRGDGGVGWALGLLAAMTGSALTLAAVAKLIHATYLRKAPARTSPEPTAPSQGDPRWVALAMTAPPVLAALLCVGLGLFAERAALRPLIFPATAGEVAISGTWWSGTAAMLLGAAICAGGLLYLAAVGKVRRTPTYVGGEDLGRVHTSGVPATAERDVEVTGADFFDTLRKLRGLSLFYDAAERGWLDVERVVARLFRWPVEWSRRAHGGLLSTYATWVVVGLCAVLLLLGAGR